MLLYTRQIVTIGIDDYIITLKKSEAGSGEGPPEPGIRYVVLYEDAHGETAVEIMNYDELTKKHLKYIDSKHLVRCVDAIQKLHKKEQATGGNDYHDPDMMIFE